MKSRMDKYSNSFYKENRTDKNKYLYKEVEDINMSIPRTYSNSKVIDEVNKEIDIDKIKRYIEKMNSNETEKRTKINDIQIEEKDLEEDVEEKDYDLNSVLERARSQRQTNYEQDRSRKVNYSYEDIYEKIKKYNTPASKEENDDELNTNERTLVNLINTIQMTKNDTDLFEDLKGSEDTQLLGTINEVSQDLDFQDAIKREVTSSSFSMSLTNDLNETKENNVVEEIDEVKEEKEDTKEITSTSSFYTTSDIFDKKDFDDKIHEYDDDDEDDEKMSGIKVFGIILAVILLVGILVVGANFIFKLGLF